MTITREDLAAMFPRALPEWLDALYKLAPALGDHYNFNRLDWVHFCGQIAAETDGLALKRMRENMSFTSSRRIMEVYSYRLGIALKRDTSLARQYKTREALAEDLVRNPVRLADIVYGGREGTPWMEGARYIGRGPTQITHLNNYAAIGEEIVHQPGGSAYDLVNTPEMLESDPELGIRSAFADWHIKGLSRWAQADDCDTLSDALNTGNIRDKVKPHGLARRRLETNRAKKIWSRDFSLDGAAKDASAAVVAASSRPANLSTVSRKARTLSRFYTTLKTMIAGFSLGSMMEWFGIAKGLLNDVQVFISDHSVAILVCGALCAALVVKHVIGLLDQAAAEGRYIPSGAAPVPDVAAGTTA